MRVPTVVVLACLGLVLGYDHPLTPQRVGDTPPTGTPPDFDCKMRNLGWEFAKKQQPRQGGFKSVFDALELGTKCNQTFEGVETPARVVYPILTKVAFIVDPIKGNDGNLGTSVDQPLRTLPQAVALARKVKGHKTIALRGGRHELTKTLMLTPEDSHLTIQSYEGEDAVISGGKAIKATWKPYNVTNSSSWEVEQNQNAVYGANPNGGSVAIHGKTNTWQECESACGTDKRCNVFTWHDQHQGSYANECWFRYDGQWDLRAESGHVSGRMATGMNIWVADLTGQFDDITGVQIDGRRVTRARHPNSNPETDVPDHRLSGNQATWHAPTSYPDPQQVIITDPKYQRNSSYSFQSYRVGLGGACSIYDPPVSYWCSDHTQGGGAFRFRVPSGVTPKPGVLPNTPYKNAKGAIVNAWRPANWANWMFEVGDYTAASGSMTFSRGGYQGARGSNDGSAWFIENIFELLDAPNEFFWNPETHQLFLNYNGTGSPPSTSNIVSPQIKELAKHIGTQANPVKNVNYKGVTFTAAAYTYMDPHGVPSGGDWALERMGALFFQGTEGSTVDGCTLTRLDGNAIMMSGYNRKAVIQNSDISWIGDSAIAQWGITSDNNPHPEQGFDATDGNYPDGTSVLYNVIHEVGLYEKQSSFYVHGKSARVLIKGNAMFNGPRAGVNFNDGMAGGDEIAENVIFNTCRESGDHGPFNSWDRQPFLTMITGKPSMDMLWRNIHHNFFVANYEAQEAVDNDDGSCYYHTHHNFMAYSGNGMKNDFGGHDNHHYNNIYAFTGHGFGICNQLAGHIDYFYNNTVIMDKSGAYGSWDCKLDKTAPVLHDNTIYTPDGTASMCGKSLPDWVKEGHDPGTKAAKWPSTDEIIKMGHDTLWSA